MGRGEPAPGEEASDVQSEVRARVFARVVARGPPPAGLDGPSSLRAMLKGRDDYEGSDVQVAPFRLDRVALPGSMRDGPLLRDITSPEVRQVLDDLVGELLLPDVEAEAALATAGVTPYTDPALIQSRCRYRQLVTELDRRGLIHWSRRPRERVGVFFAAKKNGKLRMIIDCRRTNLRFRSPPGVDLRSAETFGRIEADMTGVGETAAGAATDSRDAAAGTAPSIGPVHLGKVDVQDCFFIGCCSMMTWPSSSGWRR